MCWLIFGRSEISGSARSGDGGRIVLIGNSFPKCTNFVSEAGGNLGAWLRGKNLVKSLKNNTLYSLAHLFFKLDLACKFFPLKSAARWLTFWSRSANPNRGTTCSTLTAFALPRRVSGLLCRRSCPKNRRMSGAGGHRRRGSICARQSLNGLFRWIWRAGQPGRGGSEGYSAAVLSWKPCLIISAGSTGYSPEKQASQY